MVRGGGGWWLPPLRNSTLLARRLDLAGRHAVHPARFGHPSERASEPQHQGPFLDVGVCFLRAKLKRTCLNLFKENTPFGSARVQAPGLDLRQSGSLVILRLS